MRNTPADSALAAQPVCAPEENNAELVISDVEMTPDEVCLYACQSSCIDAAVRCRSGWCLTHRIVMPDDPKILHSHLRLSNLYSDLSPSLHIGQH